MNVYAKTVCSIALVIFVAGCVAPVPNYCPRIPRYGKAFNEQLANELEPIPDNSAIMRVVEDYISLRDQLQACRGKDK